MRLPDELDANARVMVRDDGTDVRARRAINLTGTGAASITVADNPTTEAVDVTIDVTAGEEPITDHGALSGLEDDDHTQYQLRSEKSAADGYASLDTSSLVPTAELGTGTASSTTFLRGDQTWAVPEGGGGGPTGVGRVIRLDGSVTGWFEGNTTWPVDENRNATFTDAYATEADSDTDVAITDPQWGLSFALDDETYLVTATEDAMWSVEFTIYIGYAGTYGTVGDAVYLSMSNASNRHFDYENYMLGPTLPGFSNEAETWPYLTMKTVWRALAGDEFFANVRFILGPDDPSDALDYLEANGMDFLHSLQFTRLGEPNVAGGGGSSHFEDLFGTYYTEVDDAYINNRRIASRADPYTDDGWILVEHDDFGDGLYLLGLGTGDENQSQIQLLSYDAAYGFGKSFYAWSFSDDYATYADVELGAAVERDGSSCSAGLRLVADNSFDRACEIQVSDTQSHLSLYGTDTSAQLEVYATSGQTPPILNVHAKVVGDVDEIVLVARGQEIVQGAPNTEPADAHLSGGNTISFWLDEDNDELMVKVRYSDYTIKSGSIALA